MSNTYKTCLVKFVVYFVIGLFVTKVEFQQLFMALAFIEVLAATNPWLTK